MGLWTFYCNAVWFNVLLSSFITSMPSVKIVQSPKVQPFEFLLWYNCFCFFFCFFAYLSLIWFPPFFNYIYWEASYNSSDKYPSLLSLRKISISHNHFISLNLKKIFFFCVFRISCLKVVSPNQENFEPKNLEKS